MSAVLVPAEVGNRPLVTRSATLQLALALAPHDLSHLKCEVTRSLGENGPEHVVTIKAEGVIEHESLLFVARSLAAATGVSQRVILEIGETAAKPVCAAGYGLQVELPGAEVGSGTHSRETSAFAAMLLPLVLFPTPQAPPLDKAVSMRKVLSRAADSHEVTISNAGTTVSVVIGEDISVLGSDWLSTILKSAATFAAAHPGSEVRFSVRPSPSAEFELLRRAIGNRTLWSSSTSDAAVTVSVDSLPPELSVDELRARLDRSVGQRIGKRVDLVVHPDTRILHQFQPPAETSLRSADGIDSELQRITKVLPLWIFVAGIEHRGGSIVVRSGLKELPELRWMEIFDAVKPQVPVWVLPSPDPVVPAAPAVAKALTAFAKQMGIPVAGFTFNNGKWHALVDAHTSDQVGETAKRFEEVFGPSGILVELTPTVTPLAACVILINRFGLDSLCRYEPHTEQQPAKIWVEGEMPHPSVLDVLRKNLGADLVVAALASLWGEEAFRSTPRRYVTELDIAELEAATTAVRGFVTKLLHPDSIEASGNCLVVTSCVWPIPERVQKHLLTALSELPVPVVIRPGGGRVRPSPDALFELARIAARPEVIVHRAEYSAGTVQIHAALDGMDLDIDELKAEMAAVSGQKVQVSLPAFDEDAVFTRRMFAELPRAYSAVLQRFVDSNGLVSDLGGFQVAIGRLFNGQPCSEFDYSTVGAKSAEVPDRSKRRVMTHLPCVGVGRDGTLHEDVWSLERLTERRVRIGFHSFDASAEIRAGSLEDYSSQRLGTAWYGVNGILRLFSTSQLHGLGFRKGKPASAVSVFQDIEGGVPQGEAVLEPTVITVDRYVEWDNAGPVVDPARGSDDWLTEYTGAVALLRDWERPVADKRFGRGSNPVEDAIVWANREAGRFMVKHQLPGIFTSRTALSLDLRRKVLDRVGAVLSRMRRGVATEPEAYTSEDAFQRWAVAALETLRGKATISFSFLRDVLSGREYSTSPDKLDTRAPINKSLRDTASRQNQYVLAAHWGLLPTPTVSRSGAIAKELNALRSAAPAVEFLLETLGAIRSAQHWATGRVEETDSTAAIVKAPEVRLDICIEGFNAARLQVGDTVKVRLVGFSFPKGQFVGEVV